MPDSADNLETRLATVEDEIARLREQVALTISEAAAARVLAAGADRDVSEVRAELRAHTQVLNALRETQLEHLREMRDGFAAQGQEMRDGFAKQGREMREGFAKQAVGMTQITALLTKIAGSEGPSQRVEAARFVEDAEDMRRRCAAHGAWLEANPQLAGTALASGRANQQALAAAGLPNLADDTTA